MSKELSDEDRVLWTLVAKSVTAARVAPRAAARVRKPIVPRAESAPQPVSPLEAKLAAKPASKPADKAASRPAMPSYTPPQSTPSKPKGHIDRQTTDKLAKGRLPLEARVDLHGMTQQEAYGLLLSFVARAHDRGVRYVLVITGKGPGGDGVLRRSVPQWLATAPFRLYVSGLEHAARGHGGSGALYVRIKRARTEAP